MLSAPPNSLTSPPDLKAVSPLIWACERATIIHPTRGRIAFNPYPFQVTFLQDRTPRRLIVKARQIGMSQAVGLEASHKAAYTPDSTVLLVSRNEKLAANLLGYCYTAIETARDELPALTRQSQSEIEFANGSRIMSLPANRSTGRGFAAGDVYLDEFAFQEYAEDIYRSVSPILGHGGRLTVLSTPDGRANHFFRLWSGIDGGEWSRHLFDWRACPVYDDAWYERERPNYTAQNWASEYECDFIASGQAVFRDEDIKRCEDGWLGLQPAQPGRHYITAWDIGRRADATVGVTLDVSAEPWQLVAYERLLGVPYPAIQQRIELRHAAYPGEHWIESNGVGDPVMENLHVSVDPFTTTRKSKADAITALALAHEQGTLKHGVKQLAVECQLYQWDDKDLIQDSVMAAAIACWRADQFAPAYGAMVHRQTREHHSYAINLRGR
jgi:hypothetical protein